MADMAENLHGHFCRSGCLAMGEPMIPPPPPKFSIPNGLIEDEAAICIKIGLSVENGLRLSIAISQKRIADRLDKWEQGRVI